MRGPACPPRSDGQIALVLKRPWSDGTTEKTFTDAALVERLAALIPPARKNQVFYGGVFAPGSKLRADVVRRRPRRKPTKHLVRADRRAKRSRWESWAELLKRAFDVHGFRCPRCQGRLTLRTVVVGPSAATKILADLGRGSTGPP